MDRILKLASKIANRDAKRGASGQMDYNEARASLDNTWDRYEAAKQAAERAKVAAADEARQARNARQNERRRMLRESAAKVKDKTSGLYLRTKALAVG